MTAYWRGVFPAVTTQMHRDGSLDLDATARHLEVLIDSGVSGLVMCGSLGENQALDPEEKRAVVEAAVGVAAGRVPVLSGVAETSTPAACRYVRDCTRLGADAGGVGLDVELLDELPAECLVLASRRRVRPHLRLAVADRRCRDAGAALADVLVDAVPFTGHEPLARVPDMTCRLGQIGAVLGHHRRRPHQEVTLAGGRHLQWIDAALARPRTRRRRPGCAASRRPRATRSG